MSEWLVEKLTKFAESTQSVSSRGLLKVVQKLDCIEGSFGNS